MKFINNPILKGFNPDPSIIRVGDDYYIATSTFEWFPGVQIHHSKDLVNWKLVARPLNRVSQLDMKGNGPSCGIWAPCLSYDKGTFYLIYTDVKTLYSNSKDLNNYMVTTNDILGEWSDPIYLNSSGFDPSLFHDEGGRKWFVSMLCDHRKRKNKFGGIILQEYSTEEKKLIGKPVNVYSRGAVGLVEGPHIYKKNGYYYLILADGGTGTNHAVSMARSKTLTGPYEDDPMNPILSSRNNPALALQKAGHADIVETQKGEWYMVHLCGRQLPAIERYPLGRETCLQKVRWTEDGWLRLENGEFTPSVLVTAPDLPEHKFEREPERDDFNSEELNINFQTLRIPLGEDMLSLKERQGYLRLKGRESLNSRFHQSLVARRQQSFCYTASTCLEFEPENFKQMAGLVCLYDVENYYYLRVTYDEEMGKCLGIMTCSNPLSMIKPFVNYDEPLDKDICIEGWDRCYLRVDVDYEKLQFYYSKDEKDWVKLGPVLDASKLSDEYCSEGWFTGAFVGLCCQDLSGSRKHADFDYFEYIER